MAYPHYVIGRRSISCRYEPHRSAYCYYANDGAGCWRGANCTEEVAYVATHPGLQLIQDTILKWNPDRLTAYTDNFQRGIRPVHMAMTNEKEVTAYSFAGGHVFISDAMAIAFMAREYDPNTGNTYGMRKSPQ